MLTTTEHFDVTLVTNAAQAGGGGAVAGVLNGSKVGLFTNTPALTKTMVVADFTPPIYSGYAAQALTWSAAIRNAGGNIASHAGLINWQMSDALNPTVANGYYVTDSAGTSLLFAEFFAAPQALTDATSYFGTVLEWVANNPQAGTANVVS